jgi:hypothetical protein
MKCIDTHRPPSREEGIVGMQNLLHVLSPGLCEELVTLFLFLLCPQEYPLAALAGTACHCGFPTTQFPLHEREDEQLCAQKCSAEEFESCGTPSYFIVYQTQVQGKPGHPSRPQGLSQSSPSQTCLGQSVPTICSKRRTMQNRG